MVVSKGLEGRRGRSRSVVGEGEEREARSRRGATGEVERTIGHILPCLAQLTTLSIVLRAYSTPFLGASRLAWFDPCLATSKACLGMREVADRGEVGTGDWTGAEGMGRARREEVESARAVKRGRADRGKAARLAGSAELNELD